MSNKYKLTKKLLKINKDIRKARINKSYNKLGKLLAKRGAMYVEFFNYLR